MKVTLHLNWLKSAQSSKRAFKNPAYQALADEYSKRMQSFFPQTFSGALKEKPTSAAKTLVCDRGRKVSSQFSSEELAEKIRAWQNAGVKELKVVIGPPDGFSQADRDLFTNAELWSFGPMTLPHELAAIVVLEQLYRAGAILNSHPYHSGH